MDSEMQNIQMEMGNTYLIVFETLGQKLDFFP